MATTDVLTSRAALRNELRKELLERFEANYRKADELVEDDGTSAELPANLRVLTRADVGRIVEGLFTEPLPPPSDRHAEVTTPAMVTVSALCPECNLPNLVAVTLTSELLVDDDGKELRVKAKTKGRVHVCGQLELPDEKGNGQLSLDDAETSAKYRYELVADADPPVQLADVEDVACEAEVQTPEGGLRCHRADHEDDLHWDDERDTAWRLRLDVEGLDVEPLHDLLLLICHGNPPMPSVTTIEGWDQATRDEVATWASAVHLSASDHDDIVVPPVPVALTVAIGEAIAETLPDVDEVLAGEAVEGDDSELLPGGPVVPVTDAPSAVLDKHAGAGAVDVGLQCVGNNHVPGCEHMGGGIPPKRTGK